MSENEHEALNRIFKQVGSKKILEVLSKELSGSDLNSLLLETYRIRTKNSKATELLKKYTTNRFVQPSQINPIKLKELEIDTLKIAESHAYSPILLSPVAPLGACSIVAAVSQNKVISSLRGTEVDADATNSLAIYICERLKKGELKNHNDFLRFSTSQRVVRAQSYSKPGLVPHFTVFCLVTSGIDTGSYSFEKKALYEHIDMYQRIFNSFFETEISIRFIQGKGYKDGDGLIGRLTSFFNVSLPTIKIEIEDAKVEHSYYQGLQFKVIIKENGQDCLIGDGGFVDSQKLLGNKKERMLISAIGLDRLIQLKDRQ